MFVLECSFSSSNCSLKIRLSCVVNAPRRWCAAVFYKHGRLVRWAGTGRFKSFGEYHIFYCEGGEIGKLSGFKIRRRKP